MKVSFIMVDDRVFVDALAFEVILRDYARILGDPWAAACVNGVAELLGQTGPDTPEDVTLVPKPL